MIPVNLQNRNRLTDFENELMVLGMGLGGKLRGRDSQGVWGGYVPTAIFKMDDQQGPTEYSTWNSDQCFVAAWMGREFGRGCMTESILSSPETVTALLIGYVLSVRFVTQSCPTLFDPVDSSPPGSSVHEIFQARILGWVAIPYSIISYTPI